MSAVLDSLSSPFMQRALIEAILAGGLCGVVGVHVVLRRLSFFSVALTHATFPGVVLAALIGVSLVLGTAVFGVVVVLAIVALGRRRDLDSSTATGVVLAGGFALGVVLISAQSGFTRDLTAFLVGSILTVTATDVIVTAVVAVIVLAALAGLHKELTFGAFDYRAFEAAGFPVVVLDAILLLAIELTVVTSIPAMGTILSIALIVAPAATARLWTERVGTAMAAAAAIGMAASVAGLWLSRLFGAPAGASITLVLAAAFAASWLMASLPRIRLRLRPPVPA